jgi:hypothetical protein
MKLRVILILAIVVMPGVVSGKMVEQIPSKLPEAGVIIADDFTGSDVDIVCETRVVRLNSIKSFDESYKEEIKSKIEVEDSTPGEILKELAEDEDFKGKGIVEFTVRCKFPLKKMEK